MIFLSIIFSLWLILLFNNLIINFFVFNLLLYWFLILSIIYIYYFLVIDIDKTLTEKKQIKISNNLDFLIFTIISLSLIFSPLYHRFLYDKLFLKIFMIEHHLTLWWFITENNITILLLWVKIFIIITAIWSLIFMLWLLDRLLYPKNIISFFRKIFSFDIVTIWNEVSEENNKSTTFIIKTILLNIIKMVLFIIKKIVYFYNKLVNHKIWIEISNQFIDDNNLQNFNNQPQNSINTISNNKKWLDINNSIIPPNSDNPFIQNQLENNNQQIDDNKEYTANNEDYKQIVMWNITTPMDPNTIQQTNELNQQIINENPNIVNENIINWVDLTIPFKKLESVNFPINLIRNWKLYFSNNCIFLDQESLKYKDYIVRYYNSIIWDKNNIKKIEDIEGIFIIVYYDPVYGLVLMPKITDRRSITNISADIVKYFNQVFFKLDFFPTELKEFFIDYTSSIEKIQNTIVYYIVAKHEYDWKKRQECPTQYKPFLLKDIYQQIRGINYQEKLQKLQSFVKSKYLEMTSDERLSLLKEKYGIFFWKRKLSFAKDVDINYDWKKTSDKLIFNNTIYSAKHLALLWKTGWWKTVLLKNIIYSFLSKNETDGVDFYMIDPKTELIKEFYNYEQVKYISTDLDKHKNLLKYLVHIMTERQSKIQKWDWTETFESTWKLFKPIILIIEEFIDLNTELDKFSKSLITKLLVKGRSSGIYVIAIAQFYRADVFWAVWSQFTLMSVYNDDPATSKKMTWNESYLSKLSMGEMLYTDTFNQMYVRVPYERDYEWYLNNTMFRYKNPNDDTWKEQRLKFNIDFFIKIIKLYLEGDYSIAVTCSLLYNERVSWINDFLKFELVYIYIILTKSLSSISFTDLIVRSFIVKTLLIAINERKQQYNIHEVIASNDIKWFLKNIKTEIVNDFNQLFEKNIDILPNKKLFDRNVIKKLAIARDEADPALIEDLEMKIDPELKIETIIKILNKLIDWFTENIIYNESDKFINFFQNNSQLLIDYLKLPKEFNKDIKDIAIDDNLSGEEKINSFINNLTLILRKEKKSNIADEDNNKRQELENIITEDIITLNDKYGNTANTQDNTDIDNIVDIDNVNDIQIEKDQFSNLIKDIDINNWLKTSNNIDLKDNFDEFNLENSKNLILDSKVNNKEDERIVETEINTKNKPTKNNEINLDSLL